MNGIALRSIAAFFMPLLVTGALAQVSFSPATVYSTGGVPVAVAVRDINGDTKADAVFAFGFSSPGQVRLHLGDGAGGLAVGPTLSTGTSPFGIAIGDFNGDAIQDLAISVAGAARVAVFLGSGGGAFGPPVDYPVGNSPNSLVVADFNNDGKVDLAVACQSSNAVYVLLGNGDGTFGAATSHAVGANPFGIAVADLNGDRNADLVTSNAFSGTVSVLLGNGAGGFAAASNVSVGANPESVAAADLNRDGKADLVVGRGGPSGGAVVTLMGNGNGTFGAPSTYGITSPVTDVAVADFDGDGNADVAAATSGGSVFILAGSTTGVLGVVVGFAAGGSPRSLAVGDLNGDAKADLVVAGNSAGTVSVLLNTSMFVVTAMAWGSNEYGELGIGTMTPMAGMPAPVAVQGIDAIVSVAEGQIHTMAVRADGTAWTWGSNFNGALGDGTTEHRSLPVQVYDDTIVNPLRNVVALAGGGGQNSYALTADGRVWGWGNNLVGQTGTGDNHVTHWAYPVIGLGNVVQVAAGDGHAIALKADGTVWTWGWNNHGQLGDGTQVDRPLAQQVAGLANVIAVSAGNLHSLAMRANGTVWAWGWNERGMVGDGTTTDRFTPVQVGGLGNVRSIHSSFSHNLAIKSDGTVWAWGDNLHGQLGDGTTVHRSSPVPVAGLTGGIAQVAAGMSMSAALKSDGTVWTWGGNNWEGQLGDGLTTLYDRPTPAQVSGISGATSLALGGQHTTVILKGMTIAAMITIVQGMNLAPGPSNALSAQLSAAQSAYARGSVGAACTHVDVFGRQVTSFRGRQLSPGDADRLALGAQRTRSTLGCAA